MERHLSANDFWEKEYNPRIQVPDAQKIFDAWVERAASARANLPATFDLPYGEHQREKLDLFRAVAPRGTLVFLHGGYWRALGREFHSWVADAFVAAGINVAIPSYPLAPQASHAEIITSVSKVVPYLRAQQEQQSNERGEPPFKPPVVLVGHSAGGHLAACLAAAGQPVDAAVCISGVFDLAPLRRTRMLGGMDWTAEELDAVSPLFMEPPKADVMLAVGGDESQEFHLQSARLARAWGPRVQATLTLPGRNHFSVIDGLTQPDYELTRAIIGLF